MAIYEQPIDEQRECPLNWHLAISDQPGKLWFRNKAAQQQISQQTN